MTGRSAMVERLGTYLLVAVAGGAGASVRHAVELGPLEGAMATLAVNLLGCLLLGGFVAAVSPENRRLRAIVAGGFLGSLTTYSALATTTLDLGLLEGGGYLVATYGLGFVAVWIGGELVARGGWQWS